MNDVLTELKSLFETNFTNPYNIKRIEIGLFPNSKTELRNNDYPAIWIEPLTEEIAYSGWANNLTKEYSLRVYILMQLRVPKQVQVKTKDTFQGKTLNEYSNELIRILGTNKRLNNKVRLQSDRLTIENFQDNIGRDVKSIRVRYIDDLIPYASQTINQNDMIKQI